MREGEDYRGLGDGAVYDLLADRWALMSPCPLDVVDRHNPHVILTDGALLVWGGEKGTRYCRKRPDWRERQQFYSDGAVYDVEANAWRKFPGSPVGPGDYQRLLCMGSKLLIVDLKRSRIASLVLNP